MFGPPNALTMAAALVLGLGAGDAWAQQAKTQIWEVPLGVHVDDLPVDEFVLQACGTNGGPPSLFLDGFAEFGRCAPEPGTGLHEVWFSYDNEAEYIARALRAPEEEMARFRANQLFLHPVFFSFLIDGAGLVQGYRAVSDAREDAQSRLDADMVAVPLKLAVYGFSGWVCADLGAAAGEEPIGDRFVKERCTKVTDDGRHVAIEVRIYSKPGQPRRFDGVRVIQGGNELEVSVRLEVLNSALVAR